MPSPMEEVAEGDRYYSAKYDCALLVTNVSDTKATLEGDLGFATIKLTARLDKPWGRELELMMKEP